MRFQLEQVGPLERADLEFADLTVFVGPQASGKSLALQLLRLAIDSPHVVGQMHRHGQSWRDGPRRFLDAYLGMGLGPLWSDEFRLAVDGQPLDLAGLIQPDVQPDLSRAQAQSKLLYLPAARAMMFRDGWPRSYEDYAPGDPFCIRESSDLFRHMLLFDSFERDELFPEACLDPELSALLAADVFGGFRVLIDRSDVQLRVVLANERQRIRFMGWSAGQREFLLLYLAYLLLTRERRPAEKVDADPRQLGVEWVVIEEPEMGLHAQGMTVWFLMVFDLLRRGYRVCVSTHSPQVLEALWALRHLKHNKADPRLVRQLFAMPESPFLDELAVTILHKDLRVHYFDPSQRTTRDISPLDPELEETGDRGWGGLAEFSGRANDAVACAVSEFQPEEVM